MKEIYTKSHRTYFQSVPPYSYSQAEKITCTVAYTLLIILSTGIINRNATNMYYGYHLPLFTQFIIAITQYSFL